MAILETKKFINFKAFTPEPGKRRLPNHTEKSPTIAVSRKHEMVSFSKGCVEECAMNGKYMRLFVDAGKKIIGWQLRDQIDEQNPKGWKLVKINPTKESYQIGATSLLKELGKLPEVDSFPGLHVQKYREMNPNSPFYGETFFFAEVKEHIKK